MTKVAVVTGGAGEIGRTLVAALAADGYLVHAVDRAEAVRDVAAQAGGVGLVADVTDEAALAPLGELPRVDVLINGVGIWPLLTFDELTPARWRQSTDVNLTSAYLTTWICRQGLRAAAGAVVNVTSAIAIKGHPEMIHYAAAKAGLIGLTRSLALSLGPDGVRVNAVAPAWSAPSATSGSGRRSAARRSRPPGPCPSTSASRTSWTPCCTSPRPVPEPSPARPSSSTAARSCTESRRTRTR